MASGLRPLVLEELGGMWWRCAVGSEEAPRCAGRCAAGPRFGQWWRHRVSWANAGTQGGCGARESKAFGTQPLRFLARFGAVALAVGVSVAGKVTSAELVV